VLFKRIVAFIDKKRSFGGLITGNLFLWEMIYAIKEIVGTGELFCDKNIAHPRFFLL
jgi:hypothetical protein